MAFPGGPASLAGMNPNAGLNDQEQMMIKYMQTGMESCVGKTVMAGVMGGGLGAMFGLFMASMRHDAPMSFQPTVPISATNQPAQPSTAKPTVTPSTAPTVSSALKQSTSSAPLSTLSSTATATTGTATATAPLPTSIPYADLPLRQQLKHGLRDMYRSSLSSGRNFAKVGAIFSGTECAIEGLRAKNDLWNGVAGGCITGGVLARNAGPQAVAVGCAGFGAFSAAIDAYMRMPEDERSRPIA